MKRGHHSRYVLDGVNFQDVQVRNSFFRSDIKLTTVIPDRESGEASNKSLSCPSYSSLTETC